MTVAQYFGIMPVLNILSRDVSKLKFKWTSYRTVYVVFCCLSLAAYGFLTVAWMFKIGVEFSRCVTIIFYMSNTLAIGCFLRLSMVWPKIIIQWQATEQLISPVLKDKSNRNLSRKLKVLATVVLSLSLSELFGSWRLIN